MFTHRPLFSLAQPWDWFTQDGDRALAILDRHPNTTVFYGHIHQANIAQDQLDLHVSSRSLVFPLPAPMSQPAKTRRCRGTPTRSITAWAIAASRSKARSRPGSSVRWWASLAIAVTILGACHGAVPAAGPSSRADPASSCKVSNPVCDPAVTTEAAVAVVHHRCAGCHAEGGAASHPLLEPEALMLERANVSLRLAGLRDAAGRDTAAGRRAAHA